jgi:hypothetical protein
MIPTDDAPHRDRRDRFRHELISPLTTIYGRAQLLARTVRRSSMLTDDEQATLLAGLAMIEEAVRAVVTSIDSFDDDRGDGRRDGTIPSS